MNGTVSQWYLGQEEAVTGFTSSCAATDPEKEGTDTSCRTVAPTCALAACASMYLPLASPMQYTLGTTLPSLPITSIFSFTGTKPRLSVSALMAPRFKPGSTQTAEISRHCQNLSLRQTHSPLQTGIAQGHTRVHNRSETIPGNHASPTALLPCGSSPEKCSVSQETE